MTLPSDHIERVYAGALGKMIAVYSGRPIEGWSYEMIMKRFGEVNYYVHEALDLPLIVTDDDLSLAHLPLCAPCRITATARI